MKTRIIDLVSLIVLKFALRFAGVNAHEPRTLGQVLHEKKLEDFCRLGACPPGAWKDVSPDWRSACEAEATAVLIAAFKQI